METNKSEATEDESEEEPDTNHKNPVLGIRQEKTSTNTPAKRPTSTRVKRSSRSTNRHSKAEYPGIQLRTLVDMTVTQLWIIWEQIEHNLELRYCELHNVKIPKQMRIEVGEMKAISTDATTDLIMRIEALPARINNLGEQARSEQDDPCDDLDYLVFDKYLVVLSAICHARELIGEADEMFRPWLYELLQAATNGIHLRLEEQRVGIKLQGGQR